MTPAQSEHPYLPRGSIRSKVDFVGTAVGGSQFDEQILFEKDHLSITGKIAYSACVHILCIYKKKKYSPLLCHV